MSFSRGLLLALSALASTAGAARASDVFGDAAAPEQLWNEGEFTEGVAVRSDGLVFFSDILTDPAAHGRILVFDPATSRTRVFCHDSSKSNGLAFDSGDRLLACCGANGGMMALCEVTTDGQIRPLVQRFGSLRFNAPNDLLIHPNGSVYFSDPRYLGPEPLELSGMWVFRYNPGTGRTTLATTDIQKPNGIEVSHDGRTLYIADTNNGSFGLPGENPEKTGNMQLTAFTLADDGSLFNRRVLVDFGTETGIDGMAVDAAGRIFAAVRSPSRFGIGVYDPTGRELDFLKTDTLPTNCCFGAGNDSATLYITAGGGLYRVIVRR